MASLSSLLNPSTTPHSPPSSTASASAPASDSPSVSISATTDSPTKSTTPMSVMDIIMNQADNNAINEQKSTTKSRDKKKKVQNQTQTQMHTPTTPNVSTPPIDNTENKHNNSSTYTPIVPRNIALANDVDNESNDTTNTNINNTNTAELSGEQLQSVDQDPLKTYHTLLINSRSRHLKKNDGEPYWRNEIQFKFLMSLFFNHHRVFRNPYFNTFHGFDWPVHFKLYKDENGETHENNGELLNFFELYLVTLLKSSKISKILKARLMVDIHYALNFAVICLLVNIGRLNTTVNFDYEMRSQFRTYHSIPCLQIGDHQEIIEKYYPAASQKIPPTAYEEKVSKKNNISTPVKPLQDTPRIKSILKSVNDLSGHSPQSYAEFIEAISKEYHGMNIVSVIFFVCANEYEIGQSFFPFDLREPTSAKIVSTGSLLNDIWLRPKFRASDKLRKFLWLMYTIMETGLSIPRILTNPFNNENETVESLPPNAELGPEIAMVDQKKPYLSPTLMHIKAIIPKWCALEGPEDVDPVLNDFDTTHEVEFAARMKRARAVFVENENLNTTITNVKVSDIKEEVPVETNNPTDTGINSGSTGVLNNDQKTSKLSATSKNKKKGKHETEFTAKFYHPNELEVEQLNSYNDVALDQTYSTNNRLGTSDTDQALIFDKSRKRQNDDSVETSACNPLFLSTYELNFAEKDAVGFFNYGYTGAILSDTHKNHDGTPFITSCVKRRRVRRQASLETGMKNTVEEFTVLMNKEYKKITYASKIANARKERNKNVARFMYDLISFKQAQAAKFRHKEGNWKHFTKHAWDGGLLGEMEGYVLSGNYGDWGELKCTMTRVFNHLNFVINERIKHIEAEEEKEANKQVDFLDDVFAEL